MADKTPEKMEFGKLGAFFSDVFGSLAGDLLAKHLIDSTTIKDREKQIATMIFGPKEEDERQYNAVFLYLKKEKGDDFPRFLKSLLGRLTKPGEMKTEIQDIVRQITLQCNKEGKFDVEATGKILIMIEEMREDVWHDYRTFFNLNRESLPLNSEAECRKLQRRLDKVKERSKKLGFCQHFNFLSLTPPK